MKLSTIVIAGFALASTAGAASAAQVFEHYNYYASDSADVYVTNDSSSAYTDVNINGTDFGALAAGASTGGYYVGDPYEGGYTSVGVTVTQGGKTASGTFGLGDFDAAVTYGIGSLPNSGVPEPAAWALMLVGVGGIGAGLRASRRTKLATA